MRAVDRFSVAVTGCDDFRLTSTKQLRKNWTQLRRCVIDKEGRGEIYENSKLDAK